MSGEWFTQTNTVTVEPQCIQPIELTQTDTITVEPGPPVELPPPWTEWAKEWAKDFAGKTVLAVSVGAVVYNLKGGQFPRQASPAREVIPCIQSVINTVSPITFRVTLEDTEQPE